MDPGFTEVDLAAFTGRTLDYFNDPFTIQALIQSGDLFEFATERSELPDVATLDGRIAKYGILQMAEALFEGNKQRDLRFSPFKSETIGSYTYSLVEGRVLASLPTGISWFDVAVGRLALVSKSAISNSSISAFDRPGDVLAIEGRDVLIGPADTEDFVQGRQRFAGGQPQ